jgi:toxin ParE1/3/4
MGVAQADRDLRLFADAFESLARGVVTGRGADDIRPGHFKLSIGSHLIFFRNGVRDVIDVARILHQRMDIDRVL